MDYIILYSVTCEVNQDYGRSGIVKFESDFHDCVLLILNLNSNLVYFIQTTLNIFKHNIFISDNGGLILDEYQCLKFAGLFHDIGKFYQRADNMGMGKQAYDSIYGNLDDSVYGRNGAHSKWSADFVKDYFDDIVEDLVLHHHNPQKSGYVDLCKILQKADHHSSKERIKSVDENKVLDTPLTSIFSRISLNDKKPREYYIPLVELDFKNKKGLHPHEVYEKEGHNLVPEYNELWAKFRKEFDLIKNKDFESVLAVVKKFTSTMPSAVYTSESDISLYDHLKTTAAIANCRYLFSKEDKLTQSDSKNVYRVINGDISGIQNFIYRVNTPEDAQKGMSKRLRGRSLYLTLLTEAIAGKIILDLDLDSSNILFCGGGRFTIIAPNTSKTEEIIKKTDDEVNSYFVRKFNAELYLALVSVEASGDDLGNFNEVLSKINTLLNENKKHKFINQLNEVFAWEDSVNYELCAVCGNRTYNKEEYCPECQSHEELGGNAVNANYLIKYVSDERIPGSDFYISFLNIGYKFMKSPKKVIDLVNSNDCKFTVYRLNDTHFLDLTDEITNTNVSFDFKVLGNSIPNIDYKPLYFNHLAELSKGANKLGVLKMDVDNLGRIFSQGFNHLKDEDGESGVSISRISSLSFYMDLFFSGRINQIVDKFKVYTETFSHDEYFTKQELVFDDESKTVYRLKDDAPYEFIRNHRDEGSSTIHINYSGGDDLLVVGPYDDIIRFADEFRTRFKKWTAQNDSVNISAGITIVSPKFPIGKAALMADGELEKSKDCGRDKITLFGETLMWMSNGHVKGFDDLFEFAKFLEEKTGNGLSKGFNYSLLNIWNKTYKKRVNISDEYEWNQDCQNRLSSRAFVPLFKYKLRIINDRDLRDEIDKKGIKLMPWIKTPVSWVSLRLR